MNFSHNSWNSKLSIQCISQISKLGICSISWNPNMGSRSISKNWKLGSRFISRISIIFMSINIMFTQPELEECSSIHPHSSRKRCPDTFRTSSHWQGQHSSFQNCPHWSCIDISIWQRSSTKYVVWYLKQFICLWTDVFCHW